MNELGEIQQHGKVSMGCLRRGSPEDFRWILDPAQPWVWLPNYACADLRRWRPTRLNHLPLEVEVEARFQSVDLLLPTEVFLTSFLNAELALQPVFQMKRRVPDSLRSDRLKPESLYPVLIENGLCLHAELTYDDEVFLAAPQRETLERICRAGRDD